MPFFDVTLQKELRGQYQLKVLGILIGLMRKSKIEFLKYKKR